MIIKKIKNLFNKLKIFFSEEKKVVAKNFTEPIVLEETKVKKARKLRQKKNEN